MNICLIIFFIILVLIAIFTYLVILGASMSKTNEERMIEDQEQMEYLRNYREMRENNNMEIKRGDLFYAALDETYVGSEQTGVRPVVILQNNIGNEYSPTVIVAPITSKVNSKSIIPTHVYIKGYKNRLKQNSLILTEQIRAIDKQRLRYYIGALDIGELRKVDKALIISLGIDLERVKKEVPHREGIEEKTEFLTRKQIASYGIVARENLKHTGNLEISNEEFGKYILTLIDLYSPDEIEKQADKYSKRV
jgi:pemK family growth inhibitor